MSEWAEIIGNISNVVATALAVFSIYLSVKENARSRRDEHDRRETEQRLLWYNEIALNNLIPAVNEFVNDSRERLEQLHKNQKKETIESELKEIYETINEEFKAINLYYLKIFSKELYQECDAKLQNIYDQYSIIIDEAQQRKYLSRIRMTEIQKEREELFMLLCEWADQCVQGE